MDHTHCKANKCIECSVSSCGHHCDTENYCSLARNRVGTHETNPSMDQCTDCRTFMTEKEKPGRNCGTPPDRWHLLRSARRGIFRAVGAENA